MRRKQRKIRYIKQVQFEQANKLGQWLAYRLKKQRERNIIAEIRTKEGIRITDQEKIKKEFMDFYSKFYEGSNMSQQEMLNFLEKANIKPFNNL